MEIWLRSSLTSPTIPSGVDRAFGESDGLLRIHEDTLYEGERVLGAYQHVRDGETQNVGVAHLGTVEWIVVECETWSMIPLENLISHRTGTHTKIAAVIRTPLEAQGAGFALEEGVDALVVDGSEDMMEAALSVKAQRLQQPSVDDAPPVANSKPTSLTTFTIEAVEQAGVGDRYCLDLLSLLSAGEGLLVGSSADALFLVHSETLPSTFVPARPFRVNAGSPHSYVMMADSTTKYLAELEAGDSLMAIDAQGCRRPVVLGRLKIEQRPMLKIVGIKETEGHHNANTCHIFMQQAETVRLVTGDLTAVSVTELAAGQPVLGWIGHAARHVGRPVKGGIEER